MYILYTFQVVCVPKKKVGQTVLLIQNTEYYTQKWNCSGRI